MNLSAGAEGDAGDTGAEEDAGEPGVEAGTGPAGGPEAQPPPAHRPGELRIEVRRAGPVRIVSVGGELDRDSADGLRTALAGLPEDGLARILVDLAELSFCDSTGLNILLRARQDAEPAGVRLELVGPRPVMVRLLAVTGADAVLRIHPSIALALAEGSGRAEPVGSDGPTDSTDSTGPDGPDDPGPPARERP
ncbi:STAS domain-containing protein [Kitasatospora purpeofusca]|uniref:STAS domain-containing protein n=1 Tax=Kitasatospora purpeofusca TaxID=67352 RepID=UPI0035DCE081